MVIGLDSHRPKSIKGQWSRHQAGSLGAGTTFDIRIGSVTTEPWVTLQEVAKHLQIAEDTVHRWIAKKDLPAAKAGRVWRFKLSEVDAWMRSGGAAESNHDSSAEEG